MISKIILFTASILLNTCCVFSQKIKKIIPNEIGISSFVQGTQTMMHYPRAAPYYNTYGTNYGTGINLRYILSGKWSLFASYYRAKLMNTYDISRNDPLFFREDKKEFKPFSYYWKSNEIGIGFTYKILSRKNYSFSFEQSICTNFGQLVYENFPFEGLSSDTMKKDVVYQSGSKSEMKYVIYQISVKNMGLNILNGLSCTRTLNSKINLHLNLSLNYGFIPLIETEIDYKIKSYDNQHSTVGRLYALSNNSGLRFNLGINYSIKSK